jgi:MATE family multidrug resistance protein
MLISRWPCLVPSAQVLVALVGGIACVVAVSLVSLRSVWGRLFTDDKDIVKMLAELLPFLAAFVIGDALGASSLAYILRGAGASRL